MKRIWLENYHHGIVFLGEETQRSEVTSKLLKMDVPAVGDFSLGRGPVGGSATLGKCQLGEVPVGGL